MAMIPPPQPDETVWCVNDTFSRITEVLQYYCKERLKTAEDTHTIAHEGGYIWVAWWLVNASGRIIWVERRQGYWRECVC